MAYSSATSTWSWQYTTDKTYYKSPSTWAELSLASSCKLLNSALYKAKNLKLSTIIYSLLDKYSKRNPFVSTKFTRVCRTVCFGTPALKLPNFRTPRQTLDISDMQVCCSPKDAKPIELKQSIQTFRVVDMNRSKVDQSHWPLQSGPWQRHIARDINLNRNSIQPGALCSELNYTIFLRPYQLSLLPQTGTKLFRFGCIMV